MLKRGLEQDQDFIIITYKLNSLFKKLYSGESIPANAYRT